MNPDKSAHDIRESLSKQGRSYTVQAVFKELRKLQEDKVVVRMRQRYGLNLSWAINYMHLGDVIESNYFRHDFLLGLLPNGRKKKNSWSFHNLYRMKSFWAEILLVLVKRAESPYILSYNPHPWAYLLQSAPESQFIKALQMSNAKMFKIIGGKTPLDLASKKLWDQGLIEYSFVDSPFHSERSSYFNVIGDYIVTVKLDEALTTAVEKLYEGTKSIEELRHQEVFNLFRSKARSNVTIERNKEKASKIYRKFQQFFGFRDSRKSPLPPVINPAHTEQLGA